MLPAGAQLGARWSAVRLEEAVIALRPCSSSSIARQVSRAHRVVLSAGRVGTTSPILYQSDIWAQRGRAWLMPQITSGCLVAKRGTRCALRDSERPSARTTDTGGWQLTTGKLMEPTSGRHQPARRRRECILSPSGVGVRAEGIPTLATCISRPAPSPFGGRMTLPVVGPFPSKGRRQSRGVGQNPWHTTIASKPKAETSCICSFPPARPEQ